MADKDIVLYYIDLASFPESIRSKVPDVFRLALSMWGRVTNLTFVQASTAAGTGLGVDMGELPEDAALIEAARCTPPSVATNGRAFIMFNKNITWCMEQPDGPLPDGYADFLSVSLHEMGHYFQLNRNDEKDSIMCPVGVKARKFSLFDLAAIHRIYRVGIPIMKEEARGMYDYGVAENGDLLAIKKLGCRKPGQVEINILSSESGYSTYTCKCDTNLTIPTYDDALKYSFIYMDKRGSAMNAICGIQKVGAYGAQLHLAAEFRTYQGFSAPISTTAFVEKENESFVSYHMQRNRDICGIKTAADNPRAYIDTCTIASSYQYNSVKEIVFGSKKPDPLMHDNMVIGFSCEDDGGLCIKFEYGPAFDSGLFTECCIRSLPAVVEARQFCASPDGYLFAIYSNADSQGDYGAWLHVIDLRHKFDPTRDPKSLPDTLYLDELAVVPRGPYPPTTPPVASSASDQA